MIKEVIKILDGFKDKKILVIGDIMLDYFRWCEVNKINPEQPVAPNVDSIEETYALGGAGNVANNIVSLGAKCCLYGILGVNSEKREDGYGKRIKKICEERGINFKAYYNDEPTIVKERIMAHRQQVCRINSEKKKLNKINDELKNKILNEDLKFDVILTNPPFSTRYEWNKKDEREIIEEYKISYKGLDEEKNDRVTSLKSNVLFIERYHDLLKDGGKLLTVIDESVLNAEQEKDYRKFILDKFIIKAVISLPRNTFTNADTTTKTSILYLRKKTNPKEEQSPIFMAISQNVGHSDSGKLEPEKCDLMKIKKDDKIMNPKTETILDKFKKFENGK